MTSATLLQTLHGLFGRLGHRLSAPFVILSALLRLTCHDIDNAVPVGIIADVMGTSFDSLY